MKLEIFEEQEEDKDDVVRLRLRRDTTGVIEVVAVDRYRNTVDNGSILWFDENGRLYLNHSISKELGFDLDEKGRIKIGEKK